MRSNRSMAAVSVLTGALFLGAVALVFASGRPHVVAAQPAREQKSSAPFQTGEKLIYQIGWMSMPEAATAELLVLPRIDFYGHSAWHFQAVAHTQDPLRYVMELDDQFDSYADARTLVTRQYEMYIHEQGKKSTRKLSLNERTPGAEEISAPAGTRDPLAMLYALRENDWKRRPEMLSPVYDGTHFYQMLAHLDAAHDSVSVPAGSFNARRISVNVSSRDSGTSMHFTIWLANNGARTPVEVDADVPVGTIKGMLVRVQ